MLAHLCRVLGVESHSVGGAHSILVGVLLDCLLNRFVRQHLSYEDNDCYSAIVHLKTPIILLDLRYLGLRVRHINRLITNTCYIVFSLLTLSLTLLSMINAAM